MPKKERKESIVPISKISLGKIKRIIISAVRIIFLFSGILPEKLLIKIKNKMKIKALKMLPSKPTKNK